MTVLTNDSTVLMVNMTDGTIIRAVSGIEKKSSSVVVPSNEAVFLGI